MLQGGVLLTGILKIKRLIAQSGWSRMVNNCAFALHFGIFTLYLVMMVLLFIKSLRFFVDAKNQSFSVSSFFNFFDIQIAVTFTTFLFQLMLFWILWRMNHSQQEISSNSSNRTSVR